MHELRSLHQGWTVQAVAPDRAAAPIAAAPIPATVPGCVHTDLLAAGLIDDPYLDDNEKRLAWIGHTDWAYETVFDAPWPASRVPADGGQAGADRVDLVAAGLDTVATVTLNGVEIGRTANMHRSYRFDVRGLVRPTGNRLRVEFESAYAYAHRVRDLVGERPAAYGEPFQYIRKMACNFGWDWGPTLVTAGIWQPIGLATWSVARLAQVRPVVTVDGDTGRVDVRVTVERAAQAALGVEATVAGRTGTAVIPPGATGATVHIELPYPRLWWPRGYGEQHRYELAVTLRGPDEVVLDTWRRRIGFRTVTLDTGPDAEGTRFVLRVNDTPVFVRGVNWIPDDAFLTRVDRARYADRLGQACAAGVNFVRVWGGGRYESEDFYDLADELGLLVGQDFLFACAAYPEEEPLASEVAAEAREQVVRLMPHPSLVMWVGNNENIWGWHDWGWPAALGGRTWGRGYYLDLLPSIVAELDPTRPYWPGSPYSGDPDRHPNDPAHGTTHIWDVWNTKDYRHYRSYRPRFVAEFGFQAPPAYATLRRAVSDEPLTPDSPGLAHHQKAEDGNGKLARGLAGHFPPPRDFDDWHWATQLNQARAITLGVEYFRSLRPLCMGTIVWQLNDDWPVTSWSAVDGDGRRKPLWYALRRCYADRLLTIQPHEAGLAVVAVNDGGTPWRAEFEVQRLSFTGEPRAKTTVGVEVPPGAATTVPLPPEVSRPDDPAAELIVAGTGWGAKAGGGLAEWGAKAGGGLAEWGAKAGGGLAGWGAKAGSGVTEAGRAVWFFAEDVDLAYPAADFEVAVRPAPAGIALDVTARTLLRDLALFPDRLDPAATVDDQLVTLLPGETVTFTVDTAVSLDPAALAAPPVLRCANDLVRATSSRPR